MPLPKIIHFIWAGGEKLLPEINIERIKAWAVKNPDFEVWLWIDNKTTSKEKLNVYYSQYKFSEYPKIILKDITQEEVVDEYSRYHIDKLVPNYGASGDLLRYSILFKIGGAYFDSDICVTDDTKPLNYNGLFDSDEKEILRISTFTQNNNAIGNDAFICTPNHPFMKEVYETAKLNHQKEIKAVSSPYHFDQKQSFFNWTIESTGPGIIVDVCKKNNMLATKCENSRVIYLQRMSDSSLKLDQSCYQPAERNEINWLLSLTRKCNTIDEAIRITLDSIYFEVKHFGILRIDDHIKNIVTALDLHSPFTDSGTKLLCGDPTKDERDIADILTLELITSHIDLSDCRLIQLITRYQCVADFYQKFTPTLHDGNVVISKDALKNNIIKASEENRRFIIHQYLSHLNKQRVNSELSDKSTIEKILKSHINELIVFYIRRCQEFTSANEDLFGLNSHDLSSQNVDKLTALNVLLTNIIQYLIKYLSEDNNNITLDLTLITKWIIEHLEIYPKHHRAIGAALYRLSNNQIVFDKQNIILNEETANRIRQLYNDLEYGSLKIDSTKSVCLTSSLSPTLFHHTPTAHLMSQNAEKCSESINNSV